MPVTFVAMALLPVAAPPVPALRGLVAAMPHGRTTLDRPLEAAPTKVGQWQARGTCNRGNAAKGNLAGRDAKHSLPAGCCATRQLGRCLRAAGGQVDAAGAELRLMKQKQLFCNWSCSASAFLSIGRRAGHSIHACFPPRNSLWVPPSITFRESGTVYNIHAPPWCAS